MEFLLFNSLSFTPSDDTIPSSGPGVPLASNTVLSKSLFFHNLEASTLSHCHLCDASTFKGDRTHFVLA